MKINMIMTPFSIVRLALAAAFLATPLPAQAQNSEQRLPAITVTGEASISKAPDIAILQSGVTSQAKTARDAMSASARLMTTVLAALKDGGIAENDIKTSRLRLDPVREPNKHTSIVGFEASSLLTVRLRDVNKSADILDRMVSAGANLVTGIHFDVSESSRLLDEARVEAVADAKRKAEIYAKAAGVTLGRPLSISEGYISRPRMQEYAMRAAPAAMPIQAGEEKIGITVSVSYELVR